MFISGRERWGRYGGTGGGKSERDGGESQSPETDTQTNRQTDTQTDSGREGQSERAREHGEERREKRERGRVRARRMQAKKERNRVVSKILDTLRVMGFHYFAILISFAVIVFKAPFSRRHV